MQTRLEAATALYVFLSLFVFVKRTVRPGGPSGRCTCGYDLSGHTPQDPCPECGGAEREQLFTTTVLSLTSHRQRAWGLTLLAFCAILSARWFIAVVTVTPLVGWHYAIRFVDHIGIDWAIAPLLGAAGTLPMTTILAHRRDRWRGIVGTVMIGLVMSVAMMLFDEFLMKRE